MRDGPLSGDVGERADDCERPGFGDSFPSADEIDKNPRRQERQNGNDVADGAGECQKRKAGDRGEADDGSAERTVGNRRVVGKSGDADRVQVRNAQADENRHYDRPGIAESDEPFEQRAERPRHHDRLDADVGGGMVDEPILEAFEISGEHERVEDDEAPEGDPVDIPDAG